MALGRGGTKASVTAGAAEWFDLVPLDQGHALRIMVHARDAWGNLDEGCDREIVLEKASNEVGGGGEAPRIVKLLHGVGEITGIRPGGAEDGERREGWT